MKNQNLAIFSVTPDRSYLDVFKLALAWIEERTDDYVIKAFSMGGLNEAHIPRTVRDKKIEKMRKDETESRAAIFLFINHPLEFSDALDKPTALVTRSIGEFHEYIHAKKPQLFAMEKELKELGEPPADISPEACEILGAIDAEYQGYGRSLHGSSTSTRHVKNHIRELKRLPTAQVPTKEQVAYWLWTQDWEGNGVRELLSYWEKTKR
ncbi:hypothetical protein EAH68_00150 [Corynebacterium hylobatis]|uniref:DUF4276 family protein n=1 Tax=Corynebacterium hylobatis TaxID=1859290 RepID=A0A430I2P2_9CORY|nr:hypothetical protein [Corynebacterium hylobatis]RSZ66012.1 hypothetical protein EAH68_00150 [Corynebacterium hylobatis]